jgi:hypothetical protein
MNQVPKLTLTGTFCELLVQIRLLQYGVQAAPPIKDSGNDLIAGQWVGIPGRVSAYFDIKEIE